MKISTRSRYGLRLMFELALRYEEPLVQLKTVAEAQEISEKYLSQIIIPLRSAGLVDSERGAQGGYRLSRPPAEITVRHIVEALEGSLYPVDCAGTKKCRRSKACPTIDVWKKLGDMIIDTLDGITLEDMIRDYRVKINLSLGFSI
ncbi:MAG: Rrf2 family transcriptional regulator [Brevinematales bacterium]|nr:Rrf2 family transcriptional regulator [Brevinematales bacterium]